MFLFFLRIIYKNNYIVNNMYFKSSLVATRGRRPPWREMRLRARILQQVARASTPPPPGSLYSKRDRRHINTTTPPRDNVTIIIIIVIRLRRRLCNGLAWYAENGTEAVVTGRRTINEAASSSSIIIIS